VANPTIFGIDIYDVLFFIGILILTMALARGTYALVRRGLDLRTGKKISKIFANLAQYVILFLGVGYGVFYGLRLDTAALAASMGLLGIAIAFSSQQIIQNFVAGIMVAVQRRIQMEDWIEITDVASNRAARVVDISLTKTTLRDPGGRITIVPNSILISSRVINYTQSGFVRIDIPFPLPIDADRKLVMELILQVLEDHEKVLPNVQGEERSALQTALGILKLKQLLGNRIDMDQFIPQVFVSEVTTLRTMLSIRIWIREIQLRENIISEILNEVLDRLDKAGLKPN